MNVNGFDIQLTNKIINVFDGDPNGFVIQVDVFVDGEDAFSKFSQPTDETSIQWLISSFIRDVTEDVKASFNEL